MNVMILSERGVPLMCETEGCASPASSAWSGWDGKSRLACERHNPMANVAVALPLNFTSRPLCHACGQPVSVAQQIA